MKKMMETKLIKKIYGSLVETGWLEAQSNFQIEEIQWISKEPYIHCHSILYNSHNNLNNFNSTEKQIYGIWNPYETKSNVAYRRQMHSVICEINQQTYNIRVCYLCTYSAVFIIMYNFPVCEHVYFARNI